MLTPQEMKHYIGQAIPDAAVDVVDKTGVQEHFLLRVISDAFKGLNLMDRQRLVYRALDVPMKDGRIHALEIKTATKDES